MASLHFITIQFIANGDLINNQVEIDIDYIIDQYNDKKRLLGKNYTKRFKLSKWVCKLQ